MSGPAALRALAQRLMPAGFGCAVLPLAAAAPPLLGAETGAVARAIPRRRQEFAIGRAALRAAIAEAGHALPPDRPIPARPDRSPDLPAGIRASLAHAGDYCIAIAAPPGGPSVGVDIEPVARDLPPGLAEAVAPFRARDLAPEQAPLIAFCAKEAMFKAQFPLTGRMVDFREVPAVIRPGRVRARLDRRLIGARWGEAGGCWLAISLWRG